MATMKLALFDRLIMTGLLLALITGGCISMSEIKETKEELKNIRRIGGVIAHQLERIVDEIKGDKLTNTPGLGDVVIKQARQIEREIKSLRIAISRLNESVGDNGQVAELKAAIQNLEKTLADLKEQIAPFLPSEGG